MKRQRSVNNVANISNPPKFEGKSVETAARVTVGKKKAKISDADHKKEEENSVDMGLAGPTDNYSVMGWNWEEFSWPSPWLGDEQMCWGSVWLPVWDMDFIGDAFSFLYNDVVWDDDIWNLRKEIPIPSHENAK